MAPGQTRGGRKIRQSSPTISEQEFLDTLPEAGDLVERAKQKKPADVRPAYLIYVVLRHYPDNIPYIIVRKMYESKTDAVEAFEREYGMWAGKESGVYPACHTKEQLSRRYLINLLDGVREMTSTEGDIGVGSSAGKIEYDIVHQDDKDMDDEDSQQRKIIIVCEESTFEMM